MTLGIDLDADTAPIGRQPHCPVINPSRSYPWYGAIIGGQPNTASDVLHAGTTTVGGERFTRQQAYALARHELKAEDLEVITVKRQATDREMWIGQRSLPPVFAFECPVIRRRKTDGAILVIAPNGDAVHVRGDGWVTKPRTRLRVGW